MAAMSCSMPYPIEEAGFIDEDFSPHLNHGSTSGEAVIVSEKEVVAHSSGRESRVTLAELVDSNQRRGWGGVFSHLSCSVACFAELHGHEASYR